MELGFTPEQELLRRNAREFAARHVAPLAAAVDEEARHPAEVFAGLAEGGWLGIPIPVEYGGAGADFVSHCIAVEEISRACSSTGFTLSFHAGIIGLALLNHGTARQREEYLVPLAKGRHLGAFSLTEPGAGTDVMAIGATAVRDGGDYVLNGVKTFVSNGPIADTYIFFVWTDRAARGRGMSAFIVPRGTPGLYPQEAMKKMGLRGSQTSEVILKDCRVGEENRLGAEGEGLAVAMAGFERGRVGIAAQACGILGAALEESIRHARDRVQFGRPIASHQAVAWMLADMATDLEAARHLTYHAARLRDAGRPFAKEASMAKLFATEAAMRHTVKAVQIHGGYGYVKGAKVERLMRDAKIAEIYEGTSEAQRMIISGRVVRP
ncbi:MAG TPA: acyl-CoA dehydrogenase family protein [Syntrophales bacterium]|nr:acyl-CoA dehydrogenase family protein [Syntrophales bacterium]HPC01956.1 acyl-CoA dehydrogenase family protein [Syntrophales bacterium]HRS87872.1 acyl-CoA dehydrogenase family protein [Syntrophales bacterium]HRV43455.1 acyl-CoA dehydrogenase family protein [Syntrophales bacterium]